MKRIPALLIAVLLCTSLVSQTVALRFNPEKNKAYTLRSLTHQTIVQTINGAQQTVENDVDYVMTMKIVDITPEFLVAEVRFDSLITKTNQMGKLVLISSALEGNMASSETSDVMSCVMNRLTKNAVYTKFDFTGKPIEVLNTKMLSDIIMKDTSSITLTGPVAETLRNQIAGTISDNGLKTMISMFTNYLPGKEVKSGEEWVHTEQSTSGGMNLDTKTTYRLLKVTGDVASVTAETAIKAAENAPSMTANGATIKYDNLQGMSKSDIKIDTCTGIVIENKSKMRIFGNLDISVQGYNLQMPMDINGESTLTSLKQ